jgi:hypothetical protein
MKVLNFIVWWGTLPLQVLLLIFMLRNRAVRHFPWFFSYNAYSVAVGVVRYAFSRNEALYPYIYWVSDGIYAILGMVVMFEVFRGLLRSLARLPLLRWSFAAITLLSATLAHWVTRSMPNDLAPVMMFVTEAEMCARFIEVLMFVLLLVLVSSLGFRWRHQAFGICAGFGIYSSCALFVATKYYEIGSRFTFSMSVVLIMAYTIAILIWLWYFSTPIAAETPRSSGPPLSLEDMERYKQIVRKTPRP